MLCFIDLFDRLVWGAAGTLQLQCQQTPSMQTWGGSWTPELISASVGVIRLTEAPLFTRFPLQCCRQAAELCSSEVSNALLCNYRHLASKGYISLVLTIIQSLPTLCWVMSPCQGSIACCRQVAVLCFIKFSGALVWGAADILQVKYSEMPSMQSLGDGPQTLGLVFASVGVGCFFGPILFNWFTPPRSASSLMFSRFLP